MWELPDCLASTADRRCAGKAGEARKDIGMSFPAKCYSVSETSMSPAPCMGLIHPLQSGSQKARADLGARVQ